MSGSGISWAICKSAPRSRQITTPVPHHSVFYRPDALPAPNQQRQSTEGRKEPMEIIGVGFTCIVPYPLSSQQHQSTERDLKHLFILTAELSTEPPASGHFCVAFVPT